MTTPNGLLAIDKNNGSAIYYFMLAYSGGMGLVHCPYKRLHDMSYMSTETRIDYVKTYAKNSEVKSLHHMLRYLMNNYYLLTKPSGGWQRSVYVTT